MNLPTEKLYSLGRHKMFKCWKCSSSDPMLVGFIVFIVIKNFGGALECVGFIIFIVRIVWC